jgi:hypothetical protein
MLAHFAIYPTTPRVVVPPAIRPVVRPEPRPPGFLQVADDDLPAAVRAARKHFYAMGWSYRAAAQVLGVGYQHLAYVLNGHRESRRLLAAVRALPPRPSAATPSSTDH